MYLATWGGYLSPLCLRARPNLLPVSCCITFLFSLPPEFCLHISSETSPPTAGKSIQHYKNYPTAASSGISPNNLQPLSPRAGVHLEHVSSGSVPGLWTNASSPTSQPPILSSTCWTHYSWPAPSFYQITSTRIRLASAWLAVCLLQCPSPTNCWSHHLHRNCRRTYLAIGAILKSLRHLFSAVPQAAGIISLGG